MKVGMICICEFASYEQEEAKALYLEKYPFDRIHQDWLKSDAGYMDMHRDSVDDSAKATLMERTKNARKAGDFPRRISPSEVIEQHGRLIYFFSTSL